MPSHYGDKKPDKVPKGLHKMPDGSLMKGDKHPKPKKTGEAVLDGETIKFKEGGLRQQLKVPKDHKFTKTELMKIQKVPEGEKFTFLGKEFKKTKLMSQRVNFALTLMKSKKK